VDGATTWQTWAAPTPSAEARASDQVLATHSGRVKESDKAPATLCGRAKELDKAAETQSGLDKAISAGDQGSVTESATATSADV
jgi:hypothetical protein